MKKQLFSIITIFIGMLSLNINAQQNEYRFFSINYGQKIHFNNFDKFKDHQNSALPELSANSRFHGMNMQGAVSDNVIVGLYGYGSLNDNENDLGYTNWGGGLAAVTGEYRFSFKSKLFISLGGGLGCGRFNYSSSLNDGSSSISVYSSAIFCEPKINIGYILKKKLIITIEASYMFNLHVSDNFTGSQNLSTAFPNAWFLGGTIGYQIRYFRKKSASEK